MNHHDNHTNGPYVRILHQNLLQSGSFEYSYIKLKSLILMLQRASKGCWMSIFSHVPSSQDGDRLSFHKFLTYRKFYCIDHFERIIYYPKKFEILFSLNYFVASGSTEKWFRDNSFTCSFSRKPKLSWCNDASTEVNIFISIFPYYPNF